MKKRVGNSLYIQGKDIRVIKSYIDLPSNIWEEFMWIDYNKLWDEFVEITDEDTINYLMDCEFIIDYNEYSKLEGKKIVDRAHSLYEKIADLCFLYNHAEFDNNIQKEEFKYNIYLNNYELESINDFVKHKRGLKKYMVPGTQNKNIKKRINTKNLFSFSR